MCIAVITYRSFAIFTSSPITDMLSALKRQSRWWRYGSPSHLSPPSREWRSDCRSGKTHIFLPLQSFLPSHDSGGCGEGNGCRKKVRWLQLAGGQVMIHPPGNPSCHYCFPQSPPCHHSPKNPGYECGPTISIFIFQGFYPVTLLLL